MSTLRLRTTPTLPLPNLARLRFLIAMLFEVFAEAQAQARAAHERYPFIE